MVITAVAALVLLVVVAVVLVVTLGGDDEDTTASDGTSPASSSAAPSASTSAESPSTSASGGFSSAPSGGGDPADFVATLPTDFVDCAEDELAGDGDVAAASCGAARTQPGPQEAKFYLYPDVATLDTVFQTDVSDEGLTEFADTGDCTTGVGYGPWTYTDGTPGGQVACQITADGHVLLAWTDEEYLTEGVVRAPGTTQAEVSALYDWWTSNSDYQR